MKWVVPRMWEGGDCFILGGGPSLLKQFEIPASVIQDVYTRRVSPKVYSPFLQSIHKKHVIAVNVAYKIGDWIDVMFFGDDSTWNEEKFDLMKFPGLRVTCCEGIPDNLPLKYLIRDGGHKTGLSSDPGMVAWNYNSGAAAINFAVHTGVKRIILLGFDMKLDNEENQHWHKLYINQLHTPKETIESTLSKHLRGFPEIAEDAKKLGIEIINANPYSAITDFPRMNLKDIEL